MSPAPEWPRKVPSVPLAGLHLRASDEPSQLTDAMSVSVWVGPEYAMTMREVAAEGRAVEGFRR